MDLWGRTAQLQELQPRPEADEGAEIRGGVLEWEMEGQRARRQLAMAGRHTVLSVDVVLRSSEH